jgi:F0F1-type ATP synthase epsilon subunit
MVMANLKIRVFKAGEADPDTTCTIPGGVLKIASKLIPRQAASALRDKGIDLDEIIRLSADPNAAGTLLEVEDHKKNERVVIALE